MKHVDMCLHDLILLILNEIDKLAVIIALAILLLLRLASLSRRQHIRISR
jgi:hypothetical protein